MDWKNDCSRLFVMPIGWRGFKCNRLSNREVTDRGNCLTCIFYIHNDICYYNYYYKYYFYASQVTMLYASITGDLKSQGIRGRFN